MIVSCRRQAIPKVIAPLLSRGVELPRGPCADDALLGVIPFTIQDLCTEQLFGKPIFQVAENPFANHRSVQITDIYSSDSGRELISFMNAAVVHSFDASPRYATFPEPVATEAEVLLDVVAAGL